MDKRHFIGRVKEINTEARTLTAYASTADIDRDNEVIQVEAWRASIAGKDSRPLLWAHEYRMLPVGKAEALAIDENGLKFTARFANTDFANDVWNLYRDGYLDSFSVGFQPKRWEDGQSPEHPNRTYTEVELLEISAVPVPANPFATVERGVPVLTFKSLAEMTRSEKRVIPYKRTPLADRNAPWSTVAQLAAAEIDDLARMCAWYDADNPDIKVSYKLPHHLAGDDYACVWRGVVSAMGALMGGRANIPESDRRACYEHLSQHFQDFGEEAPEFRSYTEAELKTLFPDHFKDEQPAAVPSATAEASEASDPPANTHDEAETPSDELTPEQERELAEMLASVGIGLAAEYLGD